MKNKIISILFIIGAIGVFIGYIAKAINWELAPYFVTIGGTCIALAQINSPYTGSNQTVKRLYRKQTFAGLFIVASGACMLYTTGNEWIVLTTIAAVIYLYTAFRIPTIEKQDK